jgi:hypothetical protein
VIYLKKKKAAFRELAVLPFSGDKLLFLKAPSSIPTVVTNKTKCQHNGSQSHEDGIRAKSRNVVCMKCASDNGQCPTQCSCGDPRCDDDDAGWRKLLTRPPDLSDSPTSSHLVATRKNGRKK